MCLSEPRTFTASTQAIFLDAGPRAVDFYYNNLSSGGRTLVGATGHRWIVQTTNTNDRHFPNQSLVWRAVSWSVVFPIVPLSN